MTTADTLAKGPATCGLTWHTQLVLLLGPTVANLLLAVVAVTVVVVAAAITTRALTWARR